MRLLILVSYFVPVHALRCWKSFMGNAGLLRGGFAQSDLWKRKCGRAQKRGHIRSGNNPPSTRSFHHSVLTFSPKSWLMTADRLNQHHISATFPLSNQATTVVAGMCSQITWYGDKLIFWLKLKLKLSLVIKSVA